MEGSEGGKKVRSDMEEKREDLLCGRGRKRTGKEE